MSSTEEVSSPLESAGIGAGLGWLIRSSVKYSVGVVADMGYSVLAASGREYLGGHVKSDLFGYLKEPVDCADFLLPCVVSSLTLAGSCYWGSKFVRVLCGYSATSPTVQHHLVTKSDRPVDHPETQTWYYPATIKIEHKPPKGLDRIVLCCQYLLLTSLMSGVCALTLYGGYRHVETIKA